MMEQGSVRNLEQIQESDAGGGTPRGVTILLVALGAGCIVFAALALGGKRGAGTAQKIDPLGELVTQQSKAGQGSAKPTDLSSRDVTFPGILSDEGAPTTALAAVKGGSKAAAQAPVEPPAAIVLSAPIGTGAGGEASPPPPTDRLPVVPLPAQNVLEASPVVTRPRDSLTRAANDAAQIGAAAGPAAPPGKEGGYQLQVSSFRSQSEADQFAAQLRARGHKAYVLEARVPNRGTWYRVRIGPFPSQHAAASYRVGFEGREHVVPFIVQPQGK
ncbi:MAG: SPOR domain-containing protein [Labilithrix sp.]|nr:SPOR domain-containing protein [Labilithrix sp.]